MGDILGITRLFAAEPYSCELNAGQPMYDFSEALIVLIQLRANRTKMLQHKIHRFFSQT